VLDPPLKEQAELFGALGLTATVTSEAEARTLSATAGKIGRHLPVHVRVDTNLAGLGVPSAAVVDFLAALARIGGLRVEGLYTHIAGPYRDDEDETAAELALFERTAAMAERASLLPPLLHTLSSSGVMMKTGRTAGNMVRPGSLLYGIRMVPSPAPFPFEPIMAVKARILRTTMLGAGTNVGYRPGTRVGRPIRAAVVPFGFSDGHHLHSGAGGEILIGGRRVPIVGDAFMSCLLADISGLPDVAPGDEAILIGRQGDETIAVEEVAARCGLRASAIPFLGSRVARTYRTGSEAFSRNHGPSQ
jgi:alanine racemase